jgi:hypothetical protein
MGSPLGESGGSDAAPQSSSDRPVSWSIVVSEWRLRKFDLWARWRDLTYEDLEMIDRNRDRLAAALRSKYGLTGDAAETEITLWLRTLR